MLKRSTLHLLAIFAGIQGHGQSDTIPFQLTSHNNIAIQAILNEVDTVFLMFHTAGNHVGLTTAALENLSSIKWDAEHGVESWGGEATSSYSAVNTLQIGNTLLDSLEIWESTNSGPETQGKIGLDLFYGRPIEINFSEEYLVIYHSMPRVPEGYSKQKLIYENGMLFLDGSCTISEEVFENIFLLHSGYHGTLLLDNSFVLKTQIGDKIEITSQQELRDSYDNVLLTKKGNLPQFKVGETVFEDIPVGFFEGSIGRQQMSVIGGDLLKRFDMIIDSEGSSIYLKPSALFDKPFTVLE